MAKAFASKAQMERCRELVANGEMTLESFEASMKLTLEPDKLPERLHPKKEKKQKPEEVEDSKKEG